MADPVVLWSQPFTVNAGNTTGIQSLSAPVALADGTFLIAWVDDTNNVDNRVGTDIIAQHYDALGNPLGGPFQLNHFGMLANETDPTIASLSGGGFVVAYEQNSNLGDTDILYEVYDADFNRVEEGAAALGSAGADQVRNPVVVTYPGLDGFTFTFERTSVGDTDIRAWTPGGLPEFDAAQNSAEFDRRPDSASWAGGQFVTVYEEDDAGTTSIEYHIRNASSVFITQGTVTTSGEDPHVAVLDNSNFVTVWNTATGGIFAEIRGADGGLVRNNFAIANNAGDNEISSDVTALKDGGFFVVWYDTVDDRIEGRRFDADGNSVGSQITVADGAGLSRPELATLSDGRVLVSFEDGGDIRAAIVDPRDNPILGTGFDDVLTARPEGGGSLVGYLGDDQLYGGDGDDFLLGGEGADLLDGGGGTADIASYVNSSAGVTINLGFGQGAGGEATGDTLVNIEIVYGSAFNDSLTGDAGANTLLGLSGNDTIRGSAGADDMDGGDGLSDTLSYSGSLAGVTVNLATGAASGGDADGDSFEGFENVTGSSNADNLTGDDIANTLQGGSGDDVLKGLGGDDRLTGGNGNDRLVGGGGIDSLVGNSGQDTFALNKATANCDLIASFQAGTDTLEIDASSFGGGLAPGALANSQFVVNATGLAEDASDRFILNTETGELFFDTNGTGSGGDRLIATFTVAIPPLTAADFEIV